MKTKTLTDFQISISVPLSKRTVYRDEDNVRIARYACEVVITGKS